jgi:DNA-binding SARP family transcriptional activator
MIRLTILDTIDLRAADGSVLGTLLAQPKRVGLLVYLCLAGHRGFVRRDRLLAMFWPEAPTDKARNALRQGVHQLRRALGEETVLGRGADELCVPADAVGCDALEFEDRLGRGDLEGALALYRGELAPGLHVGDAPDFMEWLDQERTRLRRLALRAIGQVADQAIAAGTPGRAVEWLRRAVEMAPLEEEPVRRLMQHLDQHGDHGGAVAAYEDLADRLSRGLEVAPSAATQGLAQRIRARRGPAEPPPVASSRAMAPTVSEATVRDPQPASVQRHSRWAVGFIALVLLAAGAAWPFMSAGRSRRAAADGHTVVVTPFRVSGADPGLAYLREGMLDLLATKFAGGGTLLAADPRAVLSAWRQLSGDSLVDLPPEDAVRVARRLGAGRLLLGAAVGTPVLLTLSARLLDAETGATRATAEVMGPADSLPWLIDRLAAELLIGESGEPAQRLADLASASLPALQAYLAGREAYRRGAYRDAVRHLELATSLDSTFALAWLRLADAQDWATVAGTGGAARRALALRSRLTERDRAYLDALLGPRYPDQGTPAERLAAWQRVVEVSPFMAEGWYGLGDQLFHYGRWLDADSNLIRAEDAFDHALRLDSAYAAPLAHLVQIDIARGDRAKILRAVRKYEQLDSAGDLRDFFRWRVAVALGDSAAVARERARFRTASLTTLGRIAAWSQLEGVGVGDGLLAARIMSELAVTDAQRANAANLRLLVAGNAGQFGERGRAIHEATRLTGVPVSPFEPVFSALYWEADSADAVRALDSPEVRANTAWDLERAEYGLKWAYRLGFPVPARRLDSMLQVLGAPAPDGGAPMRALELRAAAACATGAPEAAEATSALADALARADNAYQRLTPTHLVLADCYERLGDPRSALRVVQRRPLHQWSGLAMLSSYLRAEGRYAAMLGDTATAARAYRHYLALRTWADSSGQERVREVRAALAALGRR